MIGPVYLQLLPDTPIGQISCAVTASGVLAVEVAPPDPFRWAEELMNAPVKTRGSPFPVAAQLEEYLTGIRTAFDVPIDWSLTTPFQRRVLEAVAEVPYGQTRTYGQVAAQIGKPGAARAVGGANAANPISIILPCHRLIGADGNLRGYRAPDGIRTKAWLISLERGRV